MVTRDSKTFGSTRGGSGTASEDKRSMLQSVQRAFTVLDHLAHQPPLTLAAIVEAVGFDRTIVNRILRTLQAEQFVERIDDRYALGPHALLYGYAYHDSLSLPPAALPFLMEFLKAYPNRQLMVSVAVPVGAELVIVDRVWHPDIRLDLVFGLGSRHRMDRTASGRALLASMPVEAVDALIGRARRKELEDRLAVVRRDRVDFETRKDERHSAIGAAVVNRRGTPVGGIIVSGLDLDDQLHPDSPIADQLRRTVERLGDILP